LYCQHCSIPNLYPLKNLAASTHKLIFVFALLLISTSWSIAQNSWTKYAPSGCNFSALVPGEAAKESTAVENGKIYKAVGTVEGVTYLASCSAFDFDLGDPIEQAQVGIDAFSEQLGGVIKNQKEWKVGKNMGAVAIIQAEEKGLSTEYRVLILGNKMYQMVAAWSTGDEIPTKDIKKFMKSFKLQ
jgi:hypothetical protein